MNKVVVRTDTAPKSMAAYSQAGKANGFVFVAGQGAFDPDMGDVVGSKIFYKIGRRSNLNVNSR